MQDGEALPQALTGFEQASHDLGQLRKARHELADPVLEPDLANDPDLEPKVAQQTADVVLDGNGFFLQQLASCQQGASVLAGERLHMNGPEQVDAHHLSDAARIVAVGLVHLRLQERLGVTRLDADDPHIIALLPTVILKR